MITFGVKNQAAVMPAEVCNTSFALNDMFAVPDIIDRDVIVCTNSDFSQVLSASFFSFSLVC